MHNLSDRAMKERIIGAVVLVAFAVLVVPIFLDGSAQDGDVVSQSVALPGQDTEGRSTQTIVLNRDREEPEPAAAVPVQAAPVRRDPDPPAAAENGDSDTAEIAPPADASAPAVQAEPIVTNSAESPPQLSETGMWAVQLGSFSSQENAEKLAAGLRDQGFAAFLSQLQTDAGQLHRVRIGPQKDRDSAEAVAAQLQRAGHAGQVVPHP